MPQKVKKTLAQHGDKSPHKGRKAPPPDGFFFFRGGGGGRSKRLLLPLPAGVMSESDYIMHNIFENYSSHNYIKIHYRMHLIDVFLKSFLRRAYPQI